MPTDSKCTEKTVLAASAIFGGLTFLLPSALTIFMYLSKWVPEEPDPVQRQNMLLVLAGSAVTGLVVVGAGLWYLHDSKCI